MRHFLVTIDLIGPYRMHGYVMTEKREHVAAVIDKMADYLETQKIRSLGIVLMTELATKGGVVDPVSVELVRKVAIDVGDQRVKEAIETATDFHLTSWLMPKDHPSDRPLMELH